MLTILLVPYVLCISGVNAKCLNSVLNVKVVVAAFNQEKALIVGAFSVIANLRFELRLRG